MRTLTGTAALTAAAVALTACGNVSFGTHHEDRSYTAPGGVTRLKVDAGGSRVEVTASDSPGIKVDERLRWSNDRNKPQVRHTTEGDTLKLSSKCGRQVIGVGSCGVTFRVRVPRATPVDITNRDGAIVASGLTGTVNLHNANGSITATDLRATTATLDTRDGSLRVSGRADTADLTSENGSVDATGLTAGRLTARTRDGRIRLSGTATSADLRSDNGNIEATGLTSDRLTAHTRDGGISLALAAPPSNVAAEAQNGSVELRLPSEADYAISASVSNGTRKIDSGVHENSQSKRRIQLTARDGGVHVTPN